MRTRDLDETRKPLVGRKLRNGEDSLLLDVDIRIVSGNVSQRLGGAFRSLLSQPENGLFAGLVTLEVSCKIDQESIGGIGLDAADSENRLLAKLVGRSFFAVRSRSGRTSAWFVSAIQNTACSRTSSSSGLARTSFRKIIFSFS